MNVFIAAENFKLLLLSIEVEDTQKALAEAAYIIEQSSIDWDNLLLAAERNCIQPQLAILLNKLPNTSLVPESVRKSLKEIHLQNGYTQLQNVATYFSIKKQLDAAGILAIPFKGFWLAHSYYGNLSQRESVDVDLFIDANSLEEVKAIMAKQGFVPEEPLGELTNEYILKELCEYNFDQYIENKRVFHFEFHWRISINVYEMNIRLDDLKSNIIDAELQQMDLKVFSSSANLLLAILHHGGKDQFTQLKQVLDIAQIIKNSNDLNWNWIISNAQKYYTENLLYVAVKLASMLTGITIPEELRIKVNRRLINALAKNRKKILSQKPLAKNTFKYQFNNWYFHLICRNNTRLQLKLIANEIKSSVLPALVPKKFHAYFINKKIRIQPVK